MWGSPSLYYEGFLSDEGMLSQSGKVNFKSTFQQVRDKKSPLTPDRSTEKEKQSILFLRPAVPLCPCLSPPPEEAVNGPFYLFSVNHDCKSTR